MEYIRFSAHLLSQHRYQNYYEEQSLNREEYHYSHAHSTHYYAHNNAAANSFPHLPRPRAHQEYYAQEQQQHNNESSSSSSSRINSNKYQNERQHMDDYMKDESTATTSSSASFEEKRKRRKARAHDEAPLPDEQIEHDLRSRLLSKRHKFMNDGATKLNNDKRLKLDSPDADDTNILALQRERLLLKNLLKGTYSNESLYDADNDHDDVDDDDHQPEKIKVVSKEKDKPRSKRSFEVNVLSPSAVAASLTVGLKELSNSGNNNNSLNNNCKKQEKMEVSKKATYLDLESDDEMIISDENASQFYADEHNDGDNETRTNNANNASKSKKQKKKKKKKKKRRHNDIDNLNCNELEHDSDMDNDVIVLDTKDTFIMSDDSCENVEKLQHNSKKHKVKIVKTKQKSPTPAALSISSVHSSSMNSSYTTPVHKHKKKYAKRAKELKFRNSGIDASTGTDMETSCTSRASSQSRCQSDSRSHSEVDKETKLQTKSNTTKQPAKPNETVDVLIENNNADKSGTTCDKIDVEENLSLPNYYPGVQGCRSVEEFQCLNRIEEGTYGVVYRARDKRTREIVALKRLKMEKEKEGFPITSLREINTLLKGQHPNIVTVREIVVGSNMDKIFIVMDYVEHDLKSLMETMKQRKQNFLPSEVKCLGQQLLRAVAHLHDNWILHRDLKTSNLLLSHKGILKVGDFGLAREYGSPLKRYTSLVVTLWYRAPELLLGSPQYSTPIDMWSVGCIFAELLLMRPLFTGDSEIDQINRIFKELGTPNEDIWPGFKQLPAVKNILNQNTQFNEYASSNLRKRFGESVTDLGIELLHGMLTYCPEKRLTAESALKHSYFKELPLPIDPSMFPTWPAKSELGVKRKSAHTAKPPIAEKPTTFKQQQEINLTANNENGSNTTTVVSGSNAKIVSGIITGNKKSATSSGFVLNAGVEQRQYPVKSGFNAKF